jgi:hypothetical protein
VDFRLTETDQVDGSVGFKLPFVQPGSLDVSASGKINTARKGTRTFKNQDTFGNLLTRYWYRLCHDLENSVDEAPIQPIPQPERILYPITDSIGLRQVVKTFLSIASWQDGLDTFVDELAFTTTIDGKVGSTITLSPVPKQFRLVSGSANLAGNRVDLHKVKISLAFPIARPAQKASPKTMPGQKPPKPQTTEALLNAMETQGGYKLNPSWRASYALCVADGRSREDEFKDLRLTAPEVYCLDSTDAFFPRGNGVNNSLRTGSREDFKAEQRKLEDRQRSAAPPPPAPPAGTPGARP